MVWRRKKRLFVVAEALDEPEEEPSPYTCPQLRLAIVDTGLFESWDVFGNQDNLFSQQVPKWTIDSPHADDETSSIYDTADEVGITFSDDDSSMGHGMASDRGELLYCLMATEGKGEAELVRLLFALSDHMFDDVIVAEDEVEDVLSDTQCKKLPVLTRGAETWAEMPAVTRMLARRFNLLGETNDEHLRVEATFERLRSLKVTHAKAIEYITTNNQPKDKVDWAIHQMRYVILPPVMDEWERLILASKGPYVVASGMTLADLAIMDFLDQNTAKLNQQELMADCPALCDLLMLVRSHNKVGFYLSHRATRE